MSDATLLAVCIGLPLCGICFAIDRLIKLLSGGKVTIKNHITITVIHPKDITVTLETTKKQGDKHVN